MSSNKSKRQPIRKTSSIYSGSSVSVQNIEFPAPTATFLTNLNKTNTKFEQISPTKPNYQTQLLPPLPHYDKITECEKYKGKQICVNVEQLPILKTKDVKLCRPRPKPLNQTEEQKQLRKTFCKKDSRFSLPSESIEMLNEVEKMLKVPKTITTGKRLSNQTIKSQANSKLKPPCPASLMGAAAKKNKFIGKCTGKEFDKQLPYEKHNKYDFTLTEDPRQLHCLNNPYFKEKKIDFIEKVKLADNISTDKSTASLPITICEEIDLENPYKLDFQGIDYQVSYENDEQNFQNVREYRIIKRYRDRRATKKAVAEAQAKEELAQKFAVPEFFDINYKYEQNGNKFAWSEKEIIQETEIEDNKLAKIYRTPEKIFNKTLTEFETDQRKGRYLNLYLARKELEKEQEKINREIEEQNEEYKCVNLGQQIFDAALNQEPTNNIEDLKNTMPKENKTKKYPHNLKETKRLRHKMKKSKLIIREKAKVREEYCKQLGKNRIINEAHLQFSDLSQTQSSLTEQSTDDEDNLQIGEINSIYRLRGFHAGLGNQIRGKFHKKEQLNYAGHVHGCMTRNEWFQKIQPDKKTGAFYSYNPPPVPLFQDPNDKKLALFPPKPLQPKPIDKSPINVIIQQQIGNQYSKSYVKNLKIKKPKTIKVKKFNLTGYMYGTVDDNKLNMNKSDILSICTTKQEKDFGVSGLMEYIRTKVKLNKLRKRRKRRQRMHYLGIPCDTIKLNKKQQLCVHSSSSESSDWIPPYNTSKDYNSIKLKASLINFGRSQALSLQEGGPKEESRPDHLIPAPDYREPTMRHNYYERYKNIPENLNIPYLFPPENTKRIEPNLYTIKKKYMKVLEARHHHDHIDPTQHKFLQAKYKPKSPKIETININQNNVDDQKTDNDENKTKGFIKAIPDRMELRDLDLSLPNDNNTSTNYIDNDDKLINIGEPESKTSEIEYYETENNDKKPNNINNTTNNGNKKNMDNADDYTGEGYYHSLTNPPRNFDCHKAFMQLIDDMIKEIKRQQQADGIIDDTNDMIINKDEYIKELNHELLSMKSCLSSLSSSVCTNFTNDSGSFLMIQDKKVPMDYIRKALVPFEELNRVRVKGEQRKQFMVNNNPFNTCPFAGQLREQTMRQFEKFHTFKTRIQNDVRARLHVPTEDLKNKLLGPYNNTKYQPLVAIDLDEIYINELHNRPPVKIFKPKSTMNVVKDALRKKYVCWSIQQKIVELKAVQEIELNYYEVIIQLRDLLKNLFQKWEKQYYEASMQTLSKVKPYYELTDKMKKSMLQLEQNNLSLNMEIIMIEDDFRRRLVLQNFHYLIMKNSWREKNDWIHLNDDGELENYRESIQKRYIVNVRQRDRDDAWIIKDYYENIYLKNLHPIVIVFPDADSFIGGVDSLKSKTFVCLLELHFALWVWTTLEQKLNQFLNWSTEFLLKQTKFVKTKCAKKYFMEDREYFLIQKTTALMNIPLAKSISTYDMRLFMAICDVVYEKIVPLNIRSNVKDDIDVVDKTSLIWDTMIDLFNEIDSLPRELFTTVESSYRSRLKYQLRMSKQACQIEKRIFTSMEEVKRNLAPPFVKPKREGKLPRLYLNKKRTIAKPLEKQLSEKTKFFYYAFHDDTSVLTSTEDLRGSVEILGNIQDENIPFHFDHFLKQYDYIPNYSFKTQIELNDGPEEDLFRCKAILPEVFAKLQHWEQAKQNQMESDIKKYAYMYEDVKI